MIWYVWGALLIVMGVAALAFGRLLAYRNNDMQSAVWGRFANTSPGRTNYNAAKNKVVGALMILVGVAAIVAHLAGTSF